jgi:hypothetical protein
MPFESQPCETEIHVIEPNRPPPYAQPNGTKAPPKLKPAIRSALLVIGGIFVGLIVMVIVGARSASPRPAIPASGSSHTVVGELRIRDSYAGFDVDRPTCDGHRGYNDIQAGAEVLISDSEGKILAKSVLGPGKPGEADYTSNRSYTCTFSFEVESTPNADFYQVRIAGRSGLTYSRDELARANWRVEASLG